VGNNVQSHFNCLIVLPGLFIIHFECEHHVDLAHAVAKEQVRVGLGVGEGGVLWKGGWKRI
jgi:hypothetical protein